MDREQIISEAMRLLGSAKTPAKVAAARAVAESRKGCRMTEEQRQKMADGQARRRERERIAKGAAPKPAPDPTAPKRGPGRPRKVVTDRQNAAQDGTGAAETHG